MVPPAQNVSTLFCTTCGYDLTGLRECQCPECGTHFSLSKLREENRQLAINPKRVVLQFILFPGIAILLTAFGFLFFNAGYWDAILFIGIAVFGGLPLSIIAAYYTAVKLGRYTTLPASKGIAARPSIVRIFLFWLLLSLIACGVIWFVFKILEQITPIPDSA